MKLKCDTTGFALALACVGMLMPGDALAYIDPGTGSMILPSVSLVPSMSRSVSDDFLIKPI